jgi:cyclopropane-fatty-acyl-phospholipid synthase
MSVLDLPPSDVDLQIDASRWPHLVTVPNAPVRARIARLVFARYVQTVPLRVLGPSGRVLGGGGDAEAPVMRLVRPVEFFERVGTDRLIGLGEAYQTGAWESDDVAGVLTALSSRRGDLVPPWLYRLGKAFAARIPAAEDADKTGARINAQRHYDLSNDMFSTFLDTSMTYSSALFAPGEQYGEDAGGAQLRAAQYRKVDAILDAAGVREGTRLLEIGSGWGTLAIRAAERGADVVTITLASEQLELATRRVADAGLSDRVEVRLQDYRDVEGEFDAVASVEMIEAVGEKYLPDYFAAIDRLLAQGGRAAIQAILISDAQMKAIRGTNTWSHRYIFPGGWLPSVEAIDRTLADRTTLRLRRRYDFADSYATTLRAWRERFERNWNEVRDFGFDEVFHRTWRYYLAHFEAAFRSGYLSVSQLTITR